MKSKRWVGLAAVTLFGTFNVMAGCGDSGTTTGSGGTTSSASTSKATSTGKGVTVTSSGTGGTTGDGNDTIDTATSLTPDAMGNVFTDNMDPSIALDTPDVDVDFYKFDLKKGVYLFGISAHPQGTAQDPGYIDTVLTLFGTDKAQMAQNDDPFLRTGTDSSMFVSIPADGTYYAKVEEFCESSLASGCPAGYFDSIVNTGYVFSAIPVTPGMGNILESEPNDTQATATPVVYAPVSGMAGSYYLTLLYGKSMSGDADWYSFTIPADATFDPTSRLSMEFTTQPPTTNGDGSNVNPGLLQIIDPTDMSVVSELDMTAEPTDISRASISGLPAVPGKSYLIKVPFGSLAADGQGNDYFILHGIGTGNPLEQNDATNSIPATPETLTDLGSSQFFVEGDIGTAADVDYFRVPTGGNPNINIVCGAQRSGSGLRNFKVDVFKADGVTPIAGLTDTETASHDLNVMGSIAGNTDVVIKMSASQDPVVTSTFYRCGIFPQM